MKQVNAYYRKHKTLQDCPNLTKEEIEHLQLEMKDPSHYAEKPYLYWQLENGQKIRKTRKRLASLKAAKKKKHPSRKQNILR